MILSKQQMEEIERCWLRSDVPNLLETVKDLQKKEQRARELLKRALPYVSYQNGDLTHEIEDYLK